MSNIGIARLSRTGKLAVLLALLLSASLVSSQPARPTRLSLFEGANVTVEQRETTRQAMLADLQKRSPAHSELKGLTGNIVAQTACPVGYVKNINYKFSTKDITIVRQNGVNCDTEKQCLAWEVEASPANKQEPYNLEIQVQCTADDTIPQRSRTE